MDYKNIKVVAFDFDDTLCNRRKSIYYLYKSFLDEYLEKNDDLLKEAILQDMIVHDQSGYVDKDYILKRIEEKYSVSFKDISLSKYYRSRVSDFVILFDNTIETLNYLKEKYKVTIASNGYTDLQMKKIKSKLDVALFDDILISSQCGYNKPDIRFFEEIEKRMCVSANEILFIGDNFANDVMGPLNAGLNTVWLVDENITTSYQGLKIYNIKELKKYL